MKISTLLFSFIAAICISVSLAHSEEIFSTFGPGQTFNEGTGWAVGNFGLLSSNGNIITVAAPFTPDSNVSFDSIIFAAFHTFGSDQIIVDLADDSEGIPGTTIESLGASIQGNIDEYSPKIYTVNSIVHPQLLSSIQYWVVLHAYDPTNSLFGWSWSSNGIKGVAFIAPGYDWNYYDSQPAPAFAVNGTVPEPTSLILLGTGLGFISLAAWRRRK